MIQLGNHWVPEDWPVQGEAASTFRENLLGEFFHKYMAGDVIIDVGFRGEYENPVPILPHAIGVDVDYPGYDGVTLPFADGSVDTVYSSHMLEHAPDYKATIRDRYRTLKPGASSCVSFPINFFTKRSYTFLLFGIPTTSGSIHQRHCCENSRNLWSRIATESVSCGTTIKTTDTRADPTSMPRAAIRSSLWSRKYRSRIGVCLDQKARSRISDQSRLMPKASSRLCIVSFCFVIPKNRG